MRITDLHVDGFGVWRDLRLRRLSPELTVFYGDNEAGKTTLMQFLRSMLYGVTPERRAHYLPPLEGGKPGGRLGIATDGGEFELTRYADRGDDDLGRVTVTLPDGQTQGDRLLRDSLEHIDEATFNNVFAIGLDEIHELGSLGGAEAAKSIYRLTSGLDRVSLYDVIQGLDQSRTKLLSTPDNSSIIGDLLAKRDRLEHEINELGVSNRRWSKLSVEIEEVDRQITQLRAELKTAEREARRLEVAINLKPHWTERLRVEAQVDALAGLHQLSANALSELDELKSSLEEHRRQRDILRGQRKQLIEESQELGINDALVRNGCRLDALAEQQEWLASLGRQATELTGEVKGLEDRLAAERKRLGRLWRREGDAHGAELTQKMVLDLEPQAEAMLAAEQYLTEAKRELDAKRGDERTYQSKLEMATLAGDKYGLPTDIKEATDLVGRLRKRLQADQRLEQAKRQSLELEDESHNLLDRQVLPLEWFLLLCALFMGSSTALVAYVIGQAIPGSVFGNVQGHIGLLGLLGVFATFFIRYLAEEHATEQLDACERQLEVVAKQVADAERDLQAIDAEIPVTEGSVVLRLQTAERHLAELEKMLPVESERRRAGQHVSSAEETYQSAQQELESARKTWKSRLRALGLSEDLSPAELNSLADQYAQLAAMKSKTDQRRDEIGVRERELAKVVQRIHSLAQEAGLELKDAEPLHQLEHLLAERRLQQSRIDQRKKLREKTRDLKERSLKHHKAATALENRRDGLFRSAGVADEKAYRQLAKDLEHREQLRDQVARLTREITAAIGKAGTEADFVALLAPSEISKLDRQWETLTTQCDTLDKQLQQALARRGGLAEQQRLMAEDTSLGDKQIELDCCEVQLAEARERWRERAMVGHLLELIRSDYEANRQPETLLEASNYMSALTAGRYVRVWTPLAHDVLLVDDRDGKSVPVDVLSRGTREQLFLSVRMALVAMLARRGVLLPMVLDDVLVNFDAKRAALAAKVLRDFAQQGHQLLVFTCHEHVWEMFKELNADVRRLPSRFGEEVEEEPLPTPVAVVEIVEEEPVADVIEDPVMEVIEEIEEPAPLVYASYGELAPRTIEQVIEETVEVPPVSDFVEYDFTPPSEYAPVASEVEYAWRPQRDERWETEYLPEPSYNGTEPESEPWQTVMEPVWAEVRS